MKALYMGDWAETQWYGGDVTELEAMKSDFEIDDKELQDVTIIAAAYFYENYDGQAVVVFEKDNQLYYVEAGHCSCFGLEGQWEPELINKEFIEYKIDEGSFFYGYDDSHEIKLKNHLKEYLKENVGNEN